MTEGTRNHNILKSWKEIAAYLDVSVRTCLRYEAKYGLPVHRIDQTAKSGIFAYRDELDDWLSRKGANGTLQEADKADEDEGSEAELENRPNGLETPASARGISAAPKKRGIHAAALVIVIVAVAAAFIFLLHPFPARSGEPAGFEIKGTELVVTNAGGNELWRYDTRLIKISAEEYGRSVQYKRLIGSDIYMPLAITKDIDSDGHAEVLFTTQTVGELGEGELVCFDYRGKERWRFQAGRERTYGNSVYSADYRIHGIDVHDLDGDGKLETLVVAYQRPEWPCQFTLFDCDGTLLGEFWNGGQIVDYAFEDLNDDGREEIVVSGIYNERKTGFLAVFDSTDIKGGSPQQDKSYICPELSPGSEKYYLVIPRTDVDSISSSNETLATVEILKNGRIQAMTHETSLFYEFDSNLQAVDLKGSHCMDQLHKELARQGLVRSVLNDAYYDALKKSVLYWDGARKTFTTEPAMANPW